MWANRHPGLSNAASAFSWDTEVCNAAHWCGSSGWLAATVVSSCASITLALHSVLHVMFNSLCQCKWHNSLILVTAVAGQTWTFAWWFCWWQNCDRSHMSLAPKKQHNSCFVCFRQVIFLGASHDWQYNLFQSGLEVGETWVKVTRMLWEKSWISSA